MFMFSVQFRLIYPKIMESFLSIIMRNHGYRRTLEEIKWLNVQNVERL